MIADARETVARAHGSIRSFFDMRDLVMLDGTTHSDGMPTCSYCNSISVESVLAAFQVKGTNWFGPKPAGLPYDQASGG